MGNIEYNAIDFSASLESSFIDSNKKADDRYAPKILSNNDSTCNFCPQKGIRKLHQF